MTIQISHMTKLGSLFGQFQHRVEFYAGILPIESGPGKKAQTSFREPNYKNPKSQDLYSLYHSQANLFTRNDLLKTY